MNVWFWPLLIFHRALIQLYFLNQQFEWRHQKDLRVEQPNIADVIEDNYNSKQFQSGTMKMKLNRS